MRRRHGWNAGELERRVPELLQPRLPAGQQRRDLDEDGQSRRARGDERVHGDAAQRRGDVDGLDVELVDDHRVQARRGTERRKASSRSLYRRSSRSTRRNGCSSEPAKSGGGSGGSTWNETDGWAAAMRPMKLMLEE